MPSFYDFQAHDLVGNLVDLSVYRAQVVLVVNTASACGFTPQYAGLQALYAHYAPQGFALLGFPCNQFGAQEPGGTQEIADFCEGRFQVRFAMMDKVKVNGPQAHPLFSWLKAQAPGLCGTQAIKWNFTKFLINRRGEVVRRYAPHQKPQQLAPDIEAALAAS